MHSIMTALAAAGGGSINFSLSIPAAAFVVGALGYWLAPISDKPRELLRIVAAAGAFAFLFRV